MCERSSCKLKFKIHQTTLSLPFRAKLMRSQLKRYRGKTRGKRIKNNCNCIPLFHWPDSCYPTLNHQSQNPQQNSSNWGQTQAPGFDFFFSVNNSPDKYLTGIPTVPPLICFCGTLKGFFCALKTDWRLFCPQNSGIFLPVEARSLFPALFCTTDRILGKISGTLTRRTIQTIMGLIRERGHEWGKRGNTQRLCNCSARG